MRVFANKMKLTVLYRKITLAFHKCPEKIKLPRVGIELAVAGVIV